MAGVTLAPPSLLHPITRAGTLALPRVLCPKATSTTERGQSGPTMGTLAMSLEEGCPQHSSQPRADPDLTLRSSAAHRPSPSLTSSTMQFLMGLRSPARPPSVCTVVPSLVSNSGPTVGE